VISARSHEAGTTPGSAAIGPAGVSGGASVTGVNRSGAEPPDNSPLRYWRRHRTSNVRPMSWRRAVSAMLPRWPKLSSTMQTFCASVQRRRRPVSVTD